MSEQSPLLSQESLGFDPENLRAKYVEEREKRIREDAESQFVAVGHDSPFANKYLQDDPYAQAETREVDYYPAGILFSLVHVYLRHV